MSARAPLCLLACDGARALAESVGRHLRLPVNPSHDVWFSCGEGKHVIDANIRGTDVYLFQNVLCDTQRTVYEQFTMLLHAVDAARLADADRITVVLPYLPGSRQDKRKHRVREGVSTGLFARMLMSAGVDMLLTVAPHNEATIGCYDPRKAVFEPINISAAFGRFLGREGYKCDVVASTDVGGLELARAVANQLSSGLAALSKERDYSQSSVVTRTTVIGDVADRSVLIVDDIVDTAGSVTAAVHSLWDNGATDMVIAAIHPILSGAGWERLQAIADEATVRGFQFRVVGSSSIEHANPPSFYRSFSLDPLLARIISSVNTRGSVRAVED